MGLDYNSCGILSAIHKQSPDISAGVTSLENGYGELGAGDQGMMFGYACSETPNYMPLPITLANQIILELTKWRKDHILPYLCPDAKTQVTVEYDHDQIPVRVHTVVISTQHRDGIPHSTIVKDMISLAKKIIPPELVDDKTLFHINPTGRFVIGGPMADCGLTGRKIMVDSYGGFAHHGGGAFSGKDPSKVDRSGAYAARYIAKNLVASKIAKKCEIQIAYAIGIPHPVSIKIDTFGTGKAPDATLTRIIPEVFSLTPEGIIKMLDLKRPIYLDTAFGGHFGRPELNFTWERTDRIHQLLNAL
jgi:S-adenosylmethionine synthetase